MERLDLSDFDEPPNLRLLSHFHTGPMQNPIPVFEELQRILSPLALSPPGSSLVYPQIQAKISELREWGIDEGFLELIDDSAQVMLRMRPGDECAAAARVMSEIEEWKCANPIWLKEE